jgi:hypothetical protein
VQHGVLILESYNEPMRDGHPRSFPSYRDPTRTGAATLSVSRCQPRAGVKKYFSRYSCMLLEKKKNLWAFHYCSCSLRFRLCILRIRLLRRYRFAS